MSAMPAPGSPTTPRTRVGSGPRSTRTLRLAAPLAVAPPPARRAPFVAAVLLLVGAGLVALLILNTAIAADSFTRRELSQDIDRLQLLEQQMQLDVAAAQAPRALAEAAAAQGMIPAGKPGFLVIHPDGTTEVVGAATPAARPAPPPPPGGQRQAAGPPPVDPATTGGTG